MAGHSKWANIQHRKKAQDAKRGKLFTRLIKEIVVAAKAGGADLEANPRLRLAVDKAKSQSVPKDAIDRAVKRGAGDLDGENYEEIRYEGYAPGGAAVMVDCLSDNRNRTVADVRHAFSKCGGNLGQGGSVAFMFNATGVFSFDPNTDEDELMEAAFEAGAEDVLASDDGSLEVLCTPEDYLEIKESLSQAGFTAADDEVTQRAENLAPVADDDVPKVMRLIDMLEDLDDVQNVYTNAEFSDAQLSKLEH